MADDAILDRRNREIRTMQALLGALLYLPGSVIPTMFRPVVDEAVQKGLIVQTPTDLHTIRSVVPEGMPHAVMIWPGEKGQPDTAYLMRLTEFGVDTADAMFDPTA